MNSKLMKQLGPMAPLAGVWEGDKGADVALIAGGTAEPTATTFTLLAEAGSDTYGICSNRFLDKEFKTVRYELTVTVLDQNRFLYKEDTQLHMPGKPDLFHHTDENTLTRVTG